MAKHAYQNYRDMNRPKNRLGSAIFKIVITLLILLLFAIVGLITFLTITEYKPADIEPISASGTAIRTLTTEEEFTILTWNIGYGALSDDTDFFMDGGKQVLTASPERIQQNIADYKHEIDVSKPDMILLQEVDVNSKRSNYIDEVREIHDILPNMASYYATNYKTAFVPFGIPPYGKIEGGIQTLSAFKVSSANRIALPLSYSWPLSTVQLKRCELITRIPIEGSTHELVVINEHPDAYTDEEHHAVQMAAIRETLEEEAAAGNWVIAGGDWNHTFSTVDTSMYPILQEGNWEPGYVDANDFSEGWQFIMDNSAPSSRLLDHPVVDENGVPLPDPMQLYLIDGFIMTSNVQLVSVETRGLHFKASDHNPVVMKVLLKKD